MYPKRLIPKGWINLQLLSLLALSGCGLMSVDDQAYSNRDRSAVRIPEDFALDANSGITRQEFSHEIGIDDQPGCLLAHVDSWTKDDPIDEEAEVVQVLTLTLQASNEEVTHMNIDEATLTENGKVVHDDHWIQYPLWTSLLIPMDYLESVPPFTYKIIISDESSEKKGTARGILQFEEWPNSIPCEFAAVVENNGTSGQVHLYWLYIGQITKGKFLVERSQDGDNWQVTEECTQSIEKDSYFQYSCVENLLQRETVYYYRACVCSHRESCEGCTDISHTTPMVSVRTN